MATALIADCIRRFRLRDGSFVRAGVQDLNDGGPFLVRAETTTDRVPAALSPAHRFATIVIQLQ
jgi:hypothetical protein